MSESHEARLARQREKAMLAAIISKGYRQSLMAGIAAGIFAAVVLWGVPDAPISLKLLAPLVGLVAGGLGWFELYWAWQAIRSESGFLRFVYVAFGVYATYVAFILLSWTGVFQYLAAMGRLASLRRSA